MPLVAAFRIAILYCIADDEYTTRITLINNNRKACQNLAGSILESVAICKKTAN
jgi:hypothetical protein